MSIMLNKCLNAKFKGGKEVTHDSDDAYEQVMYSLYVEKKSLPLPL